MWKYDQLRIKELIEEIDSYKTDGPGTTRLPFSEEEMQARAYVMDYMRSLGLEVTVDAIGNICGRLAGRDPQLAAVWTGSHIDTVREAGKFDGVVGVVAGLEAVRLIQENHIPHQRDICVWVYTSEESTRFGMGCVGSRAMAGHLRREELASVKGEDGISLEQLLIDRGFDLTKYDEVEKHRGQVHAAVEVHIEQSPNLEKQKKQIGIVDAICAPSNLMLTLQGVQSHAGGSSMEDRQDAFMAAAGISLALEKWAGQGQSDYTTGTVGYLELTPNAVNVIPGMVKMSVDVRDCDYDSKKYVVERFLKEARVIAASRRIRLSIEEKCDDHPMTCDPHIISVMKDICEEEGIPWMHTFSGAYHDSLFLGEFAPVAMIFVPSRDGISHSPLEWTDRKDIEAAARLLTESLIRLSNEV